MTLSVTMRVTFVVLSESVPTVCHSVWYRNSVHVPFWMKRNNLFDPLFIQCPQEVNNTSKTREIHISLK